eukprot:15452780-Alexandrium_andersonii.AAC.1
MSQALSSQEDGIPRAIGALKVGPSGARGQVRTIRGGRPGDTGVISHGRSSGLTAQHPHEARGERVSELQVCPNDKTH